MVRRASTAQSAPFRAGLVAVVGRPNVGKSTLLNVLLGEKIAIVSPHPQTTRQRVLGVLTAPGSQIGFLDTPGLHAPRHKLGVRMQHEAKEALREANVILFVASAVTKLDAGGSAHEPSESALALRELEGVQAPVVCAINKVDLVRPKSNLLPVLEAYGKAHAFDAIVPVSAKTGDGLDRLLEELRSRLPEGKALFDADTLTDQTARKLVTEFVREQILLRTRQEVPHGIAVTVDRYEESKRGVRVALTIHVAKESHKKIVVGRGGSLLKQVGTAARTDLSRLLDTPVHLTLWVRVTPDWFDDVRALGVLGYDPASSASSSTKTK
jgi:GTP-binding protein Era